MGKNTIKATERAYNYIKSAILDRSFEQGEVLTETKLATTLGISRTPVREALLLLEQKDFVQLLPKKGAMIPQISQRDIKEVMEARALIEVFAAEKTVEKRSQVAPQLRKLHKLLENQAQNAEEGDVNDFIRLDRQFHYMMVSKSDNNLLIRFYEDLRDKQLRIGIQAVAYYPERIAEVLKEHESIVAAAEEGNLDQLKASIREHLETTFSVLKSNFCSQGESL